MRKIIAVSVLGLSLAVFAGAQTSTGVRQEAIEKFRMERQQAQDQLQAAKANFQATLQAKREETKTQIEAKKTELQAKLKNIKDERKKQAVERIYTQINQLNERMTTQMANTLNKIGEALNRVKSRTDKGEANGLDVSQARSAISAAETTISSARNAVGTQAGKTYSFNVGTEETLKFDVGVARQALKTDLKTLRDQVGAARDAVRNAATSLAKIPKVNEVEVPLP